MSFLTQKVCNLLVSNMLDLGGGGGGGGEGEGVVCGALPIF